MTVDLVHQQPEGVDSSRVTRWLKAEGDTVAAGEPLLEVEADKAEIEVTSPYDGTLVEIAADVGDELFDGDLLAVFDTGGDA